MATAESNTQRAGGECPPVVVSRHIAATPGEVFALLADPGRHTDMDGSGMLRGALTNSVITGVGDEFVLKMYLERLGGDYEMINRVVEFEPDRRIAWEPRRQRDEPSPGHQWGFELTPDGDEGTLVTETFDCSRWPAEDRAFIEEGRTWIEAMTNTLEKIDTLCAAG
jgi:uncharacterized protein YndB with AHSA1/START domain